MNFTYFCACLVSSFMTGGLTYYGNKMFGRKGIIYGGIAGGVIGYGVGSYFY